MKFSINEIFDYSLLVRRPMLGEFDEEEFPFMEDYMEHYDELDIVLNELFMTRVIKGDFPSISQAYLNFTPKVKAFLRFNFHKWLHEYELTKLDYNPIYNTKWVNTRTIKGDLEKESGTTGLTNGGSITSADTGNIKNTTGKPVGDSLTDRTTTSTHFDVPYDNLSERETSKDQTHEEPLGSVTTLGTNNTKTLNTTETTTHGKNVATDYTIEDVKEGNIGVMTNQQLMEAELNFWDYFSFYKKVFEDLIANICEPFWFDDEEFS